MKTIQPQWRETAAISQALMDVKEEIERALIKFPGMPASGHEQYAVILEELDELWEHVKANTGYSNKAYDEAKQVAAMAVKYMLMIGHRRHIQEGR